jgi:hypothetical protein
MIYGARRLSTRQQHNRRIRNPTATVPLWFRKTHGVEHLCVVDTAMP